MPDSEKDTAAAEVAERWATLDLALSNKRKYPVQEFRAFVQTARRYIAKTKNDPMRPGTGSLAMWTTPRFPAWPHARAGGSRTLLSAAIRSVYPIRTAAISLTPQLLSRLKWSKRHYTATCYIRAVAADVRNAMRNFAAGLCMEVFREFFRASSRGPETTSKKFLYGGLGTVCWPSGD